MESTFRVVECIAPNSWIDGPSFVRFIMGNKGKITTAEAMWAIHEFAKCGGLLVHSSEQQPPRGTHYVHDSNPPAGIQMAEGVLHVNGDGGDGKLWSAFTFEPRHDKLDEIRKLLALSGKADARADRSPLFPKGVPENQPDLVDLVARIDAEKNSGKSHNQIARDFLGESKGNDPKSRSLLRQIRRMKKDGRVNL